MNNQPIFLLIMSASPTTGKRKGWPLKHCRRVSWYNYVLLKMFYKLNQGLLNDTVNSMYSPYEINELKEIMGRMAKLYNNRFEEYYKMSCEEKGLEYIPRGKVNKFILNI